MKKTIHFTDIDFTIVVSSHEAKQGQDKELKTARFEIYQIEDYAPPTDGAEKGEPYYFAMHDRDSEDGDTPILEDAVPTFIGTATCFGDIVLESVDNDPLFFSSKKEINNFNELLSRCWDIVGEIYPEWERFHRTLYLNKHDRIPHYEA